MKSMKTLGLTAAILVLCSTASFADLYNFSPTPANLYDLDHFYNYKWGFNWTVPSGQTITGASLFFDDIRNWDANPNILYIEMLNNAPVGVTSAFDNEAGGNAFAGQGTALHTYVNLPTTAQDLTYVFSAAEVDSMKSYLADGNIGFGFDPDCHFWNNGIKLSVTTATVPEPATMALLGSGLFGVLGLRRRKV